MQTQLELIVTTQANAFTELRVAAFAVVKGTIGIPVFFKANLDHPTSVDCPDLERSDKLSKGPSYHNGLTCD